MASSIRNTSSALDHDMYVMKRNGKKEIVSFDKILRRIKSSGKEVGIKLNYTSLTMKVIDQLYDGIPTTKIDELSAEQCAYMASIHPDYNVLAGRLVISNHHRSTSDKFSEVVANLYEYKDKHGEQSPLVSKELYDFVMSKTEELNALCDYSRDYLIDYFGFKTLEKSYLMKINKKIVERPQHMWLRVSIGIHGNNWERILETYSYMSNKYFTHATPTLFNAGTPHPQLSSCYLIAMENDSIEGIYNTLKDCAVISKWAGGIGLHVHNIRASGSHIRGTNGTSNGLIPMLRVFNNTARYVDQCLDPETIVYTTNGVKQIQDIEIGDQVFTDDGNSYRIRKVLDYSYEGDFHELTLHHSVQSLKATDMHPLWVIQTTEENTENFLDTVCHLLDRKLVEPDFIEVKNIHKNDLVGFPIPQYISDIKEFSEADCRLYGMLLGCGIMTDTLVVQLGLSTKRDGYKETYSFLKNYLTEKNIGLCSTFFENEPVDMMCFWERNNMFPFTKEMLFDRKTGNRRFLPSMLHLPNNKITCIIKGLLETVGYFDEEFIAYECSSMEMLESVRYLLLRLGILTCGSSNGFVLIIPKTYLMSNLFNITPNESFTFMEYKGVLYTQVISNTVQKKYSGRVLDIEVDNEEHHNFLTSNGLVKNGGGKRNGSIAIYLEPWHADIELFLQMRKNHGDEELKARDLFYALWIPDLFMERVKNAGNWTLMCPDECPGLSDAIGDDFVSLYETYEKNGKGRKTIPARDLWFQILDSQMETGTPYLVYKDACNKKSNQKNLGIIKSSNLCSEIVQYSSPEETSVCNLASIALPSCINMTTTPYTFDFEKLHTISKIITYNLNQIIDVNFYPTEKTKRSNMRNRPIGIGIQGLADLFFQMNMPFESIQAKELNKRIFETIYHGALEESCRLASLYGYYETFPGSPTSEGLLQFDLWGVSVENTFYDWDKLKNDIKTFGLRNSLLLAPMPTASTSQILGYNECIEPITSNIYSRRTNAGEFILANKYLMNDLIKLGLWTEEIKNNIIVNHGSIQQIEHIPVEIREKYKTVWEIPMRTLIDMASDRGIFVCQSQSLNLWLEDPNYSTLTSMHFYAWNKGLKTGIYYLRRRGRHQAQQFTIEPTKPTLNYTEEICEMCSA